MDSISSIRNRATSGRGGLPDYFALIEAEADRGKTEAAYDILSAIKQDPVPWNPGGFILRPVFSVQGDGSILKQGYDGHLLSTDVVFPFSRREARPEKRGRSKPFPFRPEPGARDRVLAQAFADLSNPAIDAMIVDDLGPNLAKAVDRRFYDRRLNTPEAQRLIEFVQKLLEADLRLVILFVSKTKLGLVEIIKQDLWSNHQNLLTQFPPRTLDRYNFKSFTPELLAEIRQSRP